MKATALFGVAGAGALMIAGAASAQEFTGLSVMDVTNDETAAEGLQTWQVYATFSSEATLLNIFDASNYSWTGEEGFHHATAFGGGLPAQATPFGVEPGNLDQPYDSFVTIGAGTNGDSVGQVSLDPSFDSDAFLNGNSFGENAGWFDGNPGSPIPAGTGTEVLIAQLTIAEGSAFGADLSGTFQTPGEGDAIFFEGASFQIPAPGALALLGFAGLVGSRRRRA